MASLDFAALGQPVSEEEPCGPDLDLTGDADYMQFLATAEGFLPASFFAFDRGSVDFDAAFKTSGELLARSRDVRLITTLAKLLILNRDLEGFVASIDLLATLLGERWQDVHPRGEDGDFSVRMASITTLDDMPPVVLPLQYVPLVQHKRHGPIAYRHQMIAAGEAAARNGELALDVPAVERALMEVELADLARTRELMTTLRAALTRIRRIGIEQVGYGEALSLEKLPGLVDKILAFVDGVLVKRDPSLVLPSEAPTGPEEEAAGEAAPMSTIAARPLSGRIKSFADAAAALAAAAAYFSRHEPSSPALLLVRQAEQLVGKSFLELIRILVPAHAEQVKVQIGREPAFTLPLLQSDTDGGAETSNQFGATSAGNNSLSDSDGMAPVVEAGTRQEAVTLLDEVGEFYRAIEPSSPIPLFTDRARSLVERDFMGLLKDLLPEAGFSAGAGSN